MKKQITELLESQNAYLEINKFCTLRRWQKDALGNAVDALEAEFSILHFASHTFKIRARDFQGIIEEVAAYQSKAFAQASERLNKQLLNGYIAGKGKVEQF